MFPLYTVATIRSAPFAIFNRQDLLQLALDLKVPVPEIYGSILKAQIALEHKAQVDANVKSTIDTPEIKSIISGVLSRANIELADDISEKVIYEIASYASHTFCHLIM